jgi:hypothetical protein
VYREAPGSPIRYHEPQRDVTAVSRQLDFPATERLFTDRQPSASR